LRQTKEARKQEEAQHLLTFFSSTTSAARANNGSKSFPRPRLFQPKQKAEAEASGLLRDKSKFGRGGKIPRRDHHLPIGGLPIMFYNSFHCSAPALSRTLGRK
jgi:hypothetical protein